MTESGNGEGRRGRREHYRRAVLAHPLRQAIVRLLASGRRNEVEIAAALDEKRGHVAYHLRVLTRHGVLKALAKGPGSTALYRRAPGAHWVRRMLEKDDDESPR